MRDINRIEPFLEKFKKVWLKYPDLRFGQLISVIANVNEKYYNIFHMEEDEWLEYIDDFMLKKYK